MTLEEMIIAQKELSKKLKLLELFDTADDYAIEFAHWLEWCDDKPKTTQELLEIFKKEKGL